MAGRSVLNKGITKLFLAELLMMLSTFCIELTPFLLEKETLLMCFGLGALVLLVIGSVINLRGLLGLRKENKNMNEAFWLTIGLIIVAVVTGILNMIDPKMFPGSMTDVAQTVINLLIAYAVIDGIREAVPAVSELGKKTLILCSVSAIVNAVLTMSCKGEAQAYVPAAIGVACALVYGIVYIVYLGKAKKATE